MNYILLLRTKTYQTLERVNGYMKIKIRIQTNWEGKRKIFEEREF